MIQRTTMTILAAALATLAGCDRVDGRSRPDTPSAGTEECLGEPSMKVRAVLSYLHQSNDAEMRKANVVRARSETPRVREFAQRVIAESAYSDKKLTDLAQRENVDLSPAAPADPMHAALRQVDKAGERTLQTISTAAFDTAYLGPETQQNGILLGAIEQAQLYADGAWKTFLDELHATVAQRRGDALVLLQDFRYRPEAELTTLPLTEDLRSDRYSRR